MSTMPDSVGAGARGDDSSNDILGRLERFELEARASALQARAASAIAAAESRQAGTVLSRHWFLIALMTVLAAASAVAATMATWTTTWDASSLVRVGRPGVFGEQFTDPAYVERILRSVAALSTDQAVLDATTTATGAPGDASTLSVEVVRETELLRYHVTDTDRPRAEATLVTFIAQSQTAVQTVYGDDLAFVVVAPTADVNEVAPPFTVRGALGAAAGFLVAVGIASLLDRRRR